MKIFIIFYSYFWEIKLFKNVFYRNLHIKTSNEIKCFSSQKFCSINEYHDSAYLIFPFNLHKQINIERGKRVGKISIFITEKKEKKLMSLSNFLLYSNFLIFLCRWSAKTNKVLHFSLFRCHVWWWLLKKQMKNMWVFDCKATTVNKLRFSALIWL